MTLREPDAWEIGKCVMTVEWLNSVLHTYDVESFQYDPAFAKRGEGDKLRRLLLTSSVQSQGNTCIFVKVLVSHEATFYKEVAPLVTRRRVCFPRLLYCGETLLILEDVCAPCWDEVDVPYAKAPAGPFAILHPRAAHVMAAYAQLHAATWTQLSHGTMQVGTERYGSLAREILAVSEWRRVMSEPWLASALGRAVFSNLLGKRSLALCRAAAPEWASCEASLRPVACVVHGDPHGGNILDKSKAEAAPTGLCLIDFEFAAVGHPVWDLALLVLNLWSSSWATDPETSLVALAASYVDELSACGVQGYCKDMCLADLGIAVPLCFIGSLLQQVAHIFNEWWQVDHEASLGDLGHCLAAFGADSLEKALEVSCEEVIARLPSSVKQNFNVYSACGAINIDLESCLDDLDLEF